MNDTPSPTDVAFVMNVAAGPSPLGAQFAGRVPTREALQSLESATRMPAAPTPESYYADPSPRLTIASITRGLGMDPSTELVWQRFLGGALTAATSEVGARQAVVAQMRDARLDSGLQKALLGRSLSFYRSCVAGRRKRFGKSFVMAMSKAGGEGSRGGKIIGHTKSGKPIYASGEGHHGNYTKQDHSDAAGAHAKQAKEYKQAFATHSEGADLSSHSALDSHVKVAKKINDARKHHEGQAEFHQLQAGTASKNERGGVAAQIGKTKSGKPIYDKLAREHHSFGPSDHREAAEALKDSHPDKAKAHADRAESMVKMNRLRRSETTEKSMRSAAATLLSESLSKGQSGGLPTIDAPTAGDLYAREDVRGGPFPGPNAGDAQGAGNSGGDDYGDVPTPATRAGQNAGDASTTGSTDDGDWKAGVPAVPEIDDWHKVPRLKEEASTAKSLSKAEGGAGSRGGNVIGHTKSGKPIYGSSHAGNAQIASAKAGAQAGKQAKTVHSDYSAADHRDAAAAHRQASEDAASKHMSDVGKLSSSGHSMQEILSHPDTQASYATQLHHNALAEAHASAAKTAKKSMTKSRVYQNGLVTYVHGGLDDRAAAMVKGGQFYHGGDSPQLHGPRNALTQHTMCKSCDTTRPTLLTACPACGDGDVLRRSVQGDPSRPRVHGQPTPFGAGLAPMRKGEVYAPGGIRLEKSKQ